MSPSLSSPLSFLLFSSHSLLSDLAASFREKVRISCRRQCRAAYRASYFTVISFCIHCVCIAPVRVPIAMKILFKTTIVIPNLRTSRMSIIERPPSSILFCCFATSSFEFLSTLQVNIANFIRTNSFLAETMILDS